MRTMNVPPTKGYTMFNKMMLYSTVTSSIALALSATLFFIPSQKTNAQEIPYPINSPQIQAQKTDDPTVNPTTSSSIEDDATPRIQVAILLDTSSSMSGLISQTRTELWSVINALSDAKKANVQPIFEVALYEYGQSETPMFSRQIRKISSFTSDFDQISESLFALETNGGEEYSGAVINEATNELLWSNTSDDLKVIFIAGNEPFDQGPIPFQEAISKARNDGIIINTIHCGDRNKGIRGKWQDGAILGAGEFFSIDQNQEVTYIETPFDKQIAQYNLDLNETYLPYGSNGKAGSQRQKAEDKNAHQNRKSYISRSLSKSSSYYSNATWDLIDASESTSFDLSTIPEEALPAILQNKSKAEQEAIITSYKEKRASIKTEMNILKKKRLNFLSKSQDDTIQNTLGASIIKALKKQAAQRSFIL
jgi:hypothetical protein